MNNKINGKRGLSPVIASVLLVMIVVILAAIVFLWALGFVSEGVSKFNDPIERACGRINFEAGVFSGKSGGYVIDVNNRAEIPLYGFNIKKIGAGEVIATKYVGNTIGTGESTTLQLDGFNFNTGDKLLIVPIILGKSAKSKVSYVCKDNFGVGVVV